MAFLAEKINAKGNLSIRNCFVLVHFKRYLHWQFFGENVIHVECNFTSLLGFATLNVATPICDAWPMQVRLV
jgi:hypothetical protein